MAAAANGSRSHVRVDGLAKVTGTAAYAFDHAFPNLAHAAAVTSTIARGEIVSFDLWKANRVPGLLRIFTHGDFAGSIQPVKHLMNGGYTNSSALPLASPEVHYAGQIISIVVAESREAAEEAAFLVEVRYRQKSSIGTFGQSGAEPISLASIKPGHKDPKLGHAEQAFSAAPVQVDAAYQTPIQHHNPMELFGTTCVWNGDRLTVYEATRYLDAAQHGLAAQLGIDPSNIRVLCPYMGGHFGSRLALSQYTAPIAFAARALNRPVKYVATRSQGFTVANHRPDTEHRIRIASTKDGEFTALIHAAQVTTSRFDDFAMQGTDVTSSLYAWRNVETSESIVRVDRNTPGPMRAPPEVPYLFALESAVDELAEKLALDPIELRRRNDTKIDLISGKPFTPRALMDCFDAGAKAFGWSARQAKTASMKQGEWLVGYGCSASVRPVKRSPASMRVQLSADGRALVETAHLEIGNGIYTVLATEAAARLGTEVKSVTVRLGDTNFPPASISGGSSTTTSLVPVLSQACNTLRDQLSRAAFPNIAGHEVRMANRSLLAPDGQRVAFAEAFNRLGKTHIETVATAAPAGAGAKAIDLLRQGKLSLGTPEKSLTWAYGAQFAEVHVHSLTGQIRVARMTGAFFAGQIMNRLTALAQLRGGMIWGIGATLLEATVLDTRSTRYVNDNLAEYLVPTAADALAVEAILLDAETHPSELMGLGELGIIGVNAALANALHHATGKRYRKLPIRLNDTLESLSG